MSTFGRQVWAALVAVAAQSAIASDLMPYRVTGDAVVAPLAGFTGDSARGRKVVLDRTTGNCLICHGVPNEPAERFQGDIGPPLDGVGTRLSEGQIRLRLIDQRLVNAATVMPPYHSVSGLSRVAPRFVGRPVLSAQDIEDVVAYLVTLK